MSNGFSPLVSAPGFCACCGRSWKTLTGYKAATWPTMHCCLVLSSLCRSSSLALSPDNASFASCNQRGMIPLHKCRQSKPESKLAALRIDAIPQTERFKYLHSLVRGGEGPGQRQHPLDLLLQPLLPLLDGVGRPTPADDGLLRARALEVQPPPQLAQRLRLPQRLPPHLHTTSKIIF
jgi:hypothetical protein